MLVVDDDVDLRSMIGLVLEGAGYSVLLASDGRMALEMLRETAAPGLILLDLYMPEMSGYQFVEHLKKTPELSSVPLILMTAANERDREDVPAVAAIRKPIDHHELLFVVRNAFRNAEPPLESEG